MLCHLFVPSVFPPDLPIFTFIPNIFFCSYCFPPHLPVLTFIHNILFLSLFSLLTSPHITNYWPIIIRVWPNLAENLGQTIHGQTMTFHLFWH